jgi:hypothetical protein
LLYYGDAIHLGDRTGPCNSSRDHNTTQPHQQLILKEPQSVLWCFCNPPHPHNHFLPRPYTHTAASTEIIGTGPTFWSWVAQPYSNRLLTGRPGLDPRQRQRTFSLTSVSRPALRLTQSPIQRVRWKCFPWR